MLIEAGAQSPTSYGLLFPKIGGLLLANPPKTPIAIISGTAEATSFKFCSTFIASNNTVLETSSFLLHNLHLFWIWIQLSVVPGTVHSCTATMYDNNTHLWGFVQYRKIDKDKKAELWQTWLRDAAYVWAPSKIFRSPWQRPRLLFPNF